MEAVSGTYPCEGCNCTQIQCQKCESNSTAPGRFDTVESIFVKGRHVKNSTQMEKVKS
jgi:hypothetical protein